MRVMSTISQQQIDRIQRRQLMRQAEGYLDLLMVFEDRWPLDLEHRSMLADRAIDALCRIKEPKGHLGYILFLKGQAAKSSERFERAIAYLLQSVELDPEYVHAYLALAWCYKRVGVIHLAVEAMESAIELEPKSAISHYNLACYLALQKQVERSVAALQLALELRPEFRENIPLESDFDPIRDEDLFNSNFGMMI